MARFSGAPELLIQSVLSDDELLEFGNNGDIAFVLRSTALNANTALTSVLIGTPVTAATPAKSLLVSNITANGDIAFFLNDTTGNSWEYLRFDGSAKLTVFNEAGSAIDYRFEGDNNSNLVVLNAATDSLAIGAAVTAGAFFTVSPYDQARTAITSVGIGIHVPAGTFTDNGAARTVAIGAAHFFGIPTFANTTNAVTLTGASTVYIAGAPVAGTNFTISNPRSLWIAGGLFFQADATDSTSGSTGAINTLGGGGFTKAVYVGTTSRLVGNVSAGTVVGTAKINAALATGTTTGGLFTHSHYSVLVSGVIGVNDLAQMTFGPDPQGSALRGWGYFGVIVTAADTWSKGDFVWGLRAVTTDTAPTELMRLTSGGSLGIGGTPGARFDVTQSLSGGVVQSRLLNTNTDVSSSAQQLISVNGAAAGDPYITWVIGGVTSWSAGISNSDADAWYLTATGNVAGSLIVRISTAGLVRMTGYGAGTATFDAAGNISSVSDIRLKDRIQDSPYGLREILALRPVQHGWNELSDLDRQGTYFGFLAQDVQRAMPLAVSVNGSGWLSYQDRAIIGASVKGIQELEARLAVLERENTALKARLAQL